MTLYTRKIILAAAANSDYTTFDRSMSHIYRFLETLYKLDLNKESP